MRSPWTPRRRWTSKAAADDGTFHSCRVISLKRIIAAPLARAATVPHTVVAPIRSVRRHPSQVGWMARAGHRRHAACRRPRVCMHVAPVALQTHWKALLSACRMGAPCRPAPTRQSRTALSQPPRPNAHHSCVHSCGVRPNAHHSPDSPRTHPRHRQDANAAADAQDRGNRVT